MKHINFNGGWEYRKIDGDGWQEVTLPHDAMIAEGHAEDARAGAAGGYYYGGRYLYRKKFTLEGERRNKYLLCFGGIAGESHIYLNGKHLFQNVLTAIFLKSE